MFSKITYLSIFSVFLLAVSFFGGASTETQVYAQSTQSETTNDLLGADEVEGDSSRTLDELQQFGSGFINNGDFLKPSDDTGSQGLLSVMVVIAFWVKNFFIAIAVIFLIIGVLTLFFSEMDANAAKKWRNNIIWTTIGIIIMQMAYSVWSSLILTSSNASTGISAALAWDFWASTIAPIIGIINLIAGFAFVAMMFYAFYIIITSAGDESGRKKGINIVIYSVVGFILLQIPKLIVDALYTDLPDCTNANVSAAYSQLNPCTKNSTQDLSGLAAIAGDVITWFNGLLAIICVLLVLYAGFLILTSRGEEERLKRARRIIIYIVIGLVILLLSHAIFRFFILA